MSFMDELRRLARPYEDDDDFLDEDLEEPFAEPGRTARPAGNARIATTIWIPATPR